MKSKSIAVLAILLAVASGFSGLVQAKQVTENSYEDSSPFIDENIVVWQGHDGNDREIFLYDISDPNAEPMQITNNAFGDISPQTDGNCVVWLGFSRSGGEIFLYDILSEETSQITNDTNVDSPPQIANGRVVWTSHQVGDSVEPGEIILYDIGTQAATTLSASVDPDGTLDDSSPRIDDTEVIWVQADGSGKTTLFICNLTKKKPRPKPAPEGYVWPNSPQEDGNLRVLTRYDGIGIDREIYVQNTRLQTLEQVTDNDIDDVYPRISGNNMAWVGGKGQASEIFIDFYDDGFISLVSPEDGAILPEKPPTTFSWNSAGYEEFKVLFSENSDFTGETLTFPRRTGKWLSETSFIPKKPEWSSIKAMEKENGSVFWRVKAKDADGNVAFSQAWSFSIE